MTCRYMAVLDTAAETWGDTCTTHGHPWPCPNDPDRGRDGDHPGRTDGDKVVHVDFTHRTRKEPHS